MQKLRPPWRLRPQRLAGRPVRGGHFRLYLHGVHGRDVVRWARACACDVCMSGACSGNRWREPERSISRVGFLRCSIVQHGGEGVKKFAGGLGPDSLARIRNQGRRSEGLLEIKRRAAGAQNLATLRRRPVPRTRSAITLTRHLT